MMTFRHIISFFLFVLATCLGYQVTLSAISKIAMKKVDARFKARGLPVNQFGPPLKITAENQTVVRSSPDLAYSICRIDLSNGPVEVRGGVWEGYSSLTIFDENTDAIFVTSLNENDDAVRGVIISPYKFISLSFQNSGLDKRIIKSDFAIALIRRLAPDEESYDRAKLAAKDDVCKLFTTQ